jgi:hypothetical protein
MADSHLIAFAHRGKADGTWDSICLRCFRTIATGPSAVWLAPKETTHTCALLDLHVLISDRHAYGPETGRKMTIEQAVPETLPLFPPESLHLK